jgi:5-methyltetrahydrofolate--homocysteine methyltransferase
LETIFDTLNAKAALLLLKKDERILIFQSWFQERLRMRQRTLSGQTVEAFLISISHTSECWFQLCLRC